MSLFQNHPFAIEAFFTNSIVVTYAIPQENIRQLLPACLEPDTFNEHAFIAAAIVQTKNLRPKGFPSFCGIDFMLTGYRIFVRYKTLEGKNLRGLYILKSETDKSLMKYLGNRMTHYNYSKIDIQLLQNEKSIRVNSKESPFDLVLNKVENPSLPTTSVFNDWKEARRFAGPLPHTFSFNNKTNEVLIVEGVRQNWTPRPIEIEKADFGFINELAPKAQPASAFLVEAIPYHWKKGRLEKWK